MVIREVLDSGQAFPGPPRMENVIDFRPTAPSGGCHPHERASEGRMEDGMM